jgi:hypothetical protein
LILNAPPSGKVDETHQRHLKFLLAHLRIFRNFMNTFIHIINDNHAGRFFHG